MSWELFWHGVVILMLAHAVGSIATHYIMAWIQRSANAEMAAMRRLYRRHREVR